MDCFASLAMTTWRSLYDRYQANFNDVRGNGFQARAPRTPLPWSALGLGRTGTFQISSAYSRMVRSEENHAMRATFITLARVHAGITCQRASIPRWHS